MYIGVNGMRIVIERSITHINELNPYEIKKASINLNFGHIHAKTRKLGSSITLGSTQDITAMRGVDMMSMMIDNLQYEMEKEIDKEILNAIMTKQRELVFKREYIYHV